MHPKPSKPPTLSSVSTSQRPPKKIPKQGPDVAALDKCRGPRGVGTLMSGAVLSELSAGVLRSASVLMARNYVAVSLFLLFWMAGRL